MKKRSFLWMVGLLWWGLSSCQLIFSPPERFPQLNERPLTGSGSYELPQWSPDGRYLAYIDDADYQGYLTIYDTTTEQHRRVATGAVHFYTWKPDGKLAYLTLTADLKGLFYDLHQVDIEGKNDQTLLRALPEVGNYHWLSDQELLILLGDVNDDSFERSLYLVDISSGVRQLVVSSRAMGFEFFSKFALSPSKELLAIHAIQPLGKGITNSKLLIYDQKREIVMQEIGIPELFPAPNFPYHQPGLGDDANFGWVTGNRWIIDSINTPEGKCYNYALVFLDIEQVENSFCIPSARGPFIDPTISPDLTIMAFVTVVGPTETYLMLADVPEEFLNRLQERKE